MYINLYRMISFSFLPQQFMLVVVADINNSSMQVLIKIQLQGVR